MKNEIISCSNAKNEKKKLPSELKFKKKLALDQHGKSQLYHNVIKGFSLACVYKIYIELMKIFQEVGEEKVEVVEVAMSLKNEQEVQILQ